MPSPETAAATLLRRARRRRDWSQAEFARRAGIPASQLCAYETSAKQPTASTLARLLAVSGTGLGLADARTERLRQAAELVDVLGLLEVLPLRPPGDLEARPFRHLVA
ncbi:MAG: helix-turn-helix domain-containing protein [Mycobacteriales bacterium]